MLTHIIAFLVMLNPFALFLYLQPVMQELSDKDFRWVLFKASLISFVILLVFLLTGRALFNVVFQIHFESFRIFGGIVIFSFAYLFIVRGQRALLHMKESLDDLASEIALPFMIGAGTISLTILMAHELKQVPAVAGLLIVLVVNALVILLLKRFRGAIKRERFRVAFDKNMEVLLRLNGFFIGAIGVDMIITGISNIVTKIL